MQPTPAIKDWLDSASKQLLAVGIPSAYLDAEVLLSYLLKQDRTYLHAHPDQKLDSLQIDNLNAKLKLRLNRVPIAYIVGYKEFYGRNFSVNPFTLIPRPESEAIIDALENILSLPNFVNKNNIELVDVGTGSGCLGITAKLEFKKINVTLIDVSANALMVAKNNAQKLSADVKTIQSDLLQNYLSKPDIIIANLPYVNKKWDRSPETDHEPSLALFADDNGMIIIKTLILQASNFLSSGSYLIIESDPVQHESLIEFAVEQSFVVTAKLGYVLVFRFQY